MNDPCINCLDFRICGGRSVNSRSLPRPVTHGLSKYEIKSGRKKTHKGSVIKEVGVYLNNGTSGDACKVIQLLELYQGKYFRLGYYIRNPKTKAWVWGQSSLTLSQGDLKKLLRRAAREGMLPTVFTKAKR